MKNLQTNILANLIVILHSCLQTTIWICLRETGVLWYKIALVALCFNLWGQETFDTLPNDTHS